MLGIVNEESFEAFHAKLVSVKDDLSGMPSITSRVNTTNARTQSLLKEEIMKLNIELHAATTGKKTGKQENKRVRNSDEGVRFATPQYTGRKLLTMSYTLSFLTTHSSTQISSRITSCFLDHQRCHHLGWKPFVEQTS